MIALLIFSLLGPAHAVDTLTLEQAMRQAGTAPSVQAARADARAAQADTTTAWLGSVAPRIGGTLTTTTRTEEIAIDTPIGAFVQQPKNLAEGGLRGSWPLVDAAGLLGRAPAAAAGARASELIAERSVDVARLQAGEAFLDVVAIDARLQALDQLVQSLSARQLQAEALVKSGLAVPVDRLRLDVALADAEVARTRLRAARDASLRVLAWRIGSDQPVEPDFVWTRPEAPPATDEVIGATGERADLQALTWQRHALARQQRGVWLEILPTVGAWGQLTWTDNEALVANQWVEGGLELSWTPLAGGTRASRSRATTARRHAVARRLEDARRGVQAELAGARAELVGALAEVEARSLAVEQAREAERILGERYGQGLAPLTDVLQATASRADQDAALQIARVQTTRAWLRWTAARGGTGT